MKKLLGIVVLGLLLSGNANAGVNEPGSGPIPIASITEVKSYYYEPVSYTHLRAHETPEHLVFPHNR